MMKGRIGTFLFIFFSAVGWSQQAETILFTEKLHDFGTIKEENGPVEHEFDFINNSPDTVRITKVRASCGCTTPGWTRTPVAPGETGFVKAKYNPFNRPGKFNKFLTVSSEGITDIRLIIKGFVDPKPKDITDELPAKMGAVRMKYRSLNLGKIYTSDTAKKFSYTIYNDSDSTVHFRDSIFSPSHIEAAINPSFLKSGEKAELKLSFDAAVLNDYGFRNDNITYFTDENGTDSLKSISVYSSLVEYFPPISQEELALAPIISFDNINQDLDRIKQGRTYDTVFKIKNEGKTSLKIREVEGNCSCIKTEIKKYEINPGEAVELKVSFDTTGRKGRQQKSVVIYSNAPKSPVSRLIIDAYVEAN